MKNSMKRLFSIVMVAAMVIVMAAACGSKKEDPAESEEVKAEVSEEQTEEPDVQEEESEEEDTDVKEEQEENAEMTEEQKPVQDEKEEFLRALKERGEDIDDIIENYDPVDILGASEEQLQELYDAVKTAVTEEYLVKYNISPSDFEWPDTTWPKGTTSPWPYLSEKIQKKAKTSWETDEEIDEDPAEYNLDQQTAELMDSAYRAIINWAQSNNYDAFTIFSADWCEIIAQHVTFD